MNFFKFVKFFVQVISLAHVIDVEHKLQTLYFKKIYQLLLEHKHFLNLWTKNLKTEIFFECFSEEEKSIKGQALGGGVPQC